MVSSFFEGEALAPFSKSSWLSTQVEPSVKETTIHISHWQYQRSRRRISSLRDRKEIKTRRLSEFSLVRAGLNHTRPAKSSDYHAVERGSVKKDFMPHEVYIYVHTRRVKSRASLILWNVWCWWYSLLGCSPFAPHQYYYYLSPL